MVFSNLKFSTKTKPGPSEENPKNVDRGFLNDFLKGLQFLFTELTVIFIPTSFTNMMLDQM